MDELLTRDDIRDKFNELYEIALLYRRRLECPHTFRREYLENELKMVEMDIEKLQDLWDKIN